ncbi:MAG: ABC transporter permease [Christensenellaceae bacterium]|nr:ABC transporter permease [Christensenellaceae bacterium]
MANINEYKHISAEKFRFVQDNEKIHDKALKTKPIGYFQDAFSRFKKNKASVVAAVILGLIILYAIIVPFISIYDIGDSDGFYTKCRPTLAIGDFVIFDSTREMTLNERYYNYYTAIGVGATDPDGTAELTWQDGIESEFNPVTAIKKETENAGKISRIAKVDSYLMIGFQYLRMTPSDFQKILDWEAENGIKVVYPMVDTSDPDCEDPTDANVWYKSLGMMPLSESGNKLTLDGVKEQGYVDNYLRDQDGNVMYYAQRDKNTVEIRVLYHNYYIYKTGHEPIFLFGSDGKGYDICTRMAYGLRLSLVLSVGVASVCFIFGAIFGAIEGYYGGWIDLLLERVVDILWRMPLYIIVSLFQLHLVNTGKATVLGGLLLAFCVTGWIGTAAVVRTQFYRFKNQEYILAARTLGAGDLRLMFRHIFPNAIGTIITSSVFAIPGVITSEATFSYLGIVNFNSSTSVSLGTMMSDGQRYLQYDPHILLIPAAVIAIMMICFNLFGNGLRDAFNPSLRGADE